MSKERLDKVINNVIQSDEERLESILKKKFKDYKLEDYVFLHEQAELVQELEDTAYSYEVMYEQKKLYARNREKENKRYRESINKAIAAFNQDEHQRGMAVLLEALEGRK